MTDVRKNLRDWLAQPQNKRMSLRGLSKRLGKNDTYLDQFLKRGSPRELTFEVKAALHKMTGMPFDLLGVPQNLVRQFGLGDEAPEGGDVEVYLPGKGSVLSTRAGFVYFKVRTNVLESSATGPTEGDILVVDVTAEGKADLKTERAVICQARSKADETVRLLLRQWIRPGLIVTNRKSGNDAMRIGDPLLPAEITILGVVRNLVRE